MKLLKKQLITKYTHHTDVISVMAIENPYPYNPLIDGFDLLLLIVSSSPDYRSKTAHNMEDGVRVQVRWTDTTGLEQWIASGDNRYIIQWLLQGEILLDLDQYLEKLRSKVLLFEAPLREQKMLVEFSSFLRTYLLAKQYLQDGQILDAYCNILEALHHWAHIAVIEHAVHPEVTVWNQVRQINPGVYKLYEELTVSTETLEQRVRLVLLACEFSVMSKMKSCCSLLFKILDSRKKPWRAMELKQHPYLAHLHIDLPLILHKLVKCSYIKEVNYEEARVVATPDKELTYTL